MKVTGAWHNVRDTGKGNLGKMFGSAFDTLSREPETLRGVDDAYLVIVQPPSTTTFSPVM